MTELLKFIVEELVDDKESVEIKEDAPNAEGVIVYHVFVAQGDMGRIIGKQGRIAKAIRTVVRATATRNNQKIMIEIGV